MRDPATLAAVREVAKKLGYVLVHKDRILECFYEQTVSVDELELAHSDVMEHVERAARRGVGYEAGKHSVMERMPTDTSVWPHVVRFRSRIAIIKEDTRVSK